MKQVSLLHLIRRGMVVCTLPSQSIQLAINIQNSIQLGVPLSVIPIAALKDLLQRPGVLATPRALQAWAEILPLHGNTLRAALEGFASSDTPITPVVACRLLAVCASLRASKNAVEYLARHLRNVPPATLSASQCVVALCGLAACYHPVTDPVFAMLVARIKQKGAACDIRLVAASIYCAALRPLFTPAFLASVVQDIRTGVYKPTRASTILLGLQFVLKGDTVRDLCNAMWRSHSGSMNPKDLFKVIRAGGDLDDMRRSLLERSAEFLTVTHPFDIFHVVVQRRWYVGALQMTLEAALLPTVPRNSQGRLLAMLDCQITLKRFNIPLTDALAKALGPKRIPLGLACTALSVSGYNDTEANMAHPRPFLEAVLAARSVSFRQITSGITLCHLLKTLVTMRHRGGYTDAPVGDVLAATAPWVAQMCLQISVVNKVTDLLVLSRHLNHSEWRILLDTIITPMYRRILEGLPTASFDMVAVALTLAPSRDRGRIGQRLVAVTGDSADAFCGIRASKVLRFARKALDLSPIDAAHLTRHFTHWCRMQSRLSHSQSVCALRLLTMAPRVSPTVLRKLFVDVRNVVTLLNSRSVTNVLVAMVRCHCVDTALIGGLMVHALAIAPSWQDEDIAPAILAMAHLRVVCPSVVEALVRQLRISPVETQRRHAPKVVEALVSMVSRKRHTM